VAWVTVIAPGAFPEYRDQVDMDLPSTRLHVDKAALDDLRS
jgi:hypothetical protein